MSTEGQQVLGHLAHGLSLAASALPDLEECGALGEAAGLRQEALSLVYDGAGFECLLPVCGRKPQSRLLGEAGQGKLNGR